MSSNSSPSAQTAHILVIGMGGTIAGLASNPLDQPMHYQAGQIGVHDLLSYVQSAIPEGIEVLSKQIANINSRDLRDGHLTSLGLAVQEALKNPQVRGIVITHGTDTLEETGVFLQIVCGQQAYHLGKRVVLTGSMLPSNAPQPDGPSNLLDAIRWASISIDNCPGGIYAVMDGRACMAMDLAKRHATALNAPIQDSPSSSVGLINPSWLSGVKSVQDLWLEDLPIPDADEWPWVEILTCHAGARSETLTRWLDSKVQGLVIAGTGNGGIHADWLAPLRDLLAHGIAIARTNRTGAGETLQDLPEIDLPTCLASGKLSAPKARIGLQLAIHAAKQANLAVKSLTWQDFFARIAVLPEIR